MNNLGQHCLKKYDESCLDDFTGSFQKSGKISEFNF